MTCRLVQLVKFEEPIHFVATVTIMDFNNELFIKLPPLVKSLIHEAQKAEVGNQPCKVHFHDIYGTTSDDLAPDIMPVEQNFYEAE